MLYEVHKFSKFIHGCAVPYWVDDASIRDSIIRSGRGRFFAKEDLETEVGPGANEMHNHLLSLGNVKVPHLYTMGCTTNTKSLVNTGPTRSAVVKGDQYNAKADVSYGDKLNSTLQGCCKDTCAGWVFPICLGYYNNEMLPPTSVQKIEPMIFFANECTFLHWLHAGVTLFKIAAGILAFASKTSLPLARWYAMALLPISLGFCMYALHLFLWRA